MRIHGTIALLRRARMFLTSGIGFAVALSSCANASTAPAARQHASYLKGTLDGASWIGEAKAVIQRTAGGPDSLLIRAESPRVGAPRSEAVRVRLPFTGVGEYQLGADQVTLEFLVGGDGVYDAFGGAFPYTGVLTITELDSARQVIRGTVQFSVVDLTARTPVLQVLHFHQGDFSITLAQP